MKLFQCAGFSLIEVMLTLVLTTTLSLAGYHWYALLQQQTLRMNIQSELQLRANAALAFIAGRLLQAANLGPFTYLQAKDATALKPWQQVPACLKHVGFLQGEHQQDLSVWPSVVTSPLRKCFTSQTHPALEHSPLLMLRTLNGPYERSPQSGDVMALAASNRIQRYWRTQLEWLFLVQDQHSHALMHLYADHQQMKGAKAGILLPNIEAWRIRLGLCSVHGSLLWRRPSELRAQDWPHIQLIQVGILLRAMKPLRGYKAHKYYLLAGQRVTPVPDHYPRLAVNQLMSLAQGGRQCAKGINTVWH